MYIYVCNTDVEDPVSIQALTVVYSLCNNLDLQSEKTCDALSFVSSTLAKNFGTAGSRAERQLLCSAFKLLHQNGINLLYELLIIFIM